MTTDQPRTGGPDATPEPARTDPTGRPPDRSQPDRSQPDRRRPTLSGASEQGRSLPGPQITGAGTPPPGPATAAFRTRPAGPPIAGAGTPPPGPPSPAATQPGASQPGPARPGVTQPGASQSGPTQPGATRETKPPRLNGHAPRPTDPVRPGPVASEKSPQDTPAKADGGPGSALSEVERARMGLAGTEPAGAPPAGTGDADRGARRFTPAWLRRRAAAILNRQPPSPRTTTARLAVDDKPGTTPATPVTSTPTPTPTPGTLLTTPATPPPGTAGTPADPHAATPTRPGVRRRRKPLPADRPPGAPPDPWTAFATTQERAPGRIRRVLRAAGRALVHEYALATYAALALAVVLTWPTLRYPMYTLPQDLFDPARQAWQIAWAGHALLTEPVQLWQANAFFPERYSFAYGSSLLGYAPAGMLGEGPAAAILRYNVLFVLAHALLTLGGYALIRQLGAGRTGAAVGAVAFAYAPWRLAQEGHLDVVSAGGIPLALAMLARGHGWSMRHGLRPERRHTGWAVAGWAVAVWQVSLGFSLGLPFAYVLAGIVLVVAVAAPIRWWRKRAAGPVLGSRLLVTDLVGALVVVGIGALIALPYVRAPGTGPATAEIDFFSPPLRGLLIGPAESRIWGAPHAVARSTLEWPAEMSLLPGFVLYALALVGLVFSVWRRWQRLVLVLGLAVAVVLTLGTTFFEGRWTYLPLFGHLPGSFGVRIPGRLMLWVTLLLAILAAGAVAEFVRRAEHLAAHRTPPWPSPWLRLAMLVPLMLVIVESWNATAHPVVPAQPAAMRTVTDPMLVLPSAALGDQTVMVWSTSRFQPVANGAGGFAARQQAELRQAVATFPDADSVDYLRQSGVSVVLLVRSQVAGTPWELSGDIPVDTLGIRREDLDDDTVLFRLD